MKGFVLAAGRGERLRPLSDSVPKPLVPVMNVPAIVYSLMLLKEAGIEEAVVNLHYRSDAIREYLKINDNFGLKIFFSYEKEILGTGGGVKKCEHLLADDDFVLVNSDIITDLGLSAVIERHCAAGSAGTVVLCAAGQGGPVAVNDNMVVDFKNFLGTGSPGSREYTGIAVLSPKIFPYLVHEPSSIVYTGFTGLVQEYCLCYYEHAGLWRDLGSISSYWEASMTLLENNRGLRGRLASHIGQDMRAVEKSVTLSEGAVLENSIAGRGCVLGKNAVVRDSVLLPDTVVGEGAVMQNAVACGEHVLAVKARP